MIFWRPPDPEILKELRLIRKALQTLAARQLGDLTAEQEAVLARRVAAMGVELERDTEALQAAMDAAQRKES